MITQTDLAAFYTSLSKNIVLLMQQAIATNGVNTKVNKWNNLPDSREVAGYRIPERDISP
jgi:hypothetical protein